MAMTAGVVDATGEATVVDFAALFALRAGRAREAARLAGAATAMRTRAGGGMELSALGLERPVDAVRGRLSDDELARSIAEGLGLDREAALAEALAELDAQPQ
jgi:hypothetical protein